MAVDIFKQTLEKEIGKPVQKEYRFAPPRKWRFDYAYPEFKIAIEIDGGIWTQGRHTRGKGFKGDMEKFNEAAKNGWLVLKFTPDECYKISTIETVKETMVQRIRERKKEYADY